MDAYDTSGLGTSNSSPAIGLGTSLATLAFLVLILASLWKVFAKAGQPGWAAIVPIYNTYIMTKITGRPAWWLLLFFIPFVNFIVAIILVLDLAKAFGKSSAFAIFGLFLFAPVGYAILAFGNAQYQGVPKH